MNYLIKFDENGRRTETYVREEKTESQINELLANGFLAISETEYQLLIGNIDGQEYIRKSDGTFTPYVPLPRLAWEEQLRRRLPAVLIWTQKPGLGYWQTIPLHG